MDIKKLLKESVDVKYYKIRLIWIMSVFALAIIAAILFPILLGINEIIVPFVSIFFMFFIALSIYPILCIIGIYRQKDYYLIREVMLDDPQTGFSRRLHFVLKIKDEDNQTITLYIKAIFFTSVLSFIDFADYHKRRALIAYNTKTTDVIVLKTIE